MSIQRIATLLLVLVVAVVLMKTLAATWSILVLIGVLLALATRWGLIERWGYFAAAICMLIALPGFVLGFIFSGLNAALRLIKMAPFLVLAGILLFWLMKGSRRW